MKKVSFGLLVAATAAVIAVPLAVAAPGNGNSDNAKLCQKDGWQSLARTEDHASGFDNQDECVSYAAHGGKLVAKEAKPAITVVSAPTFGLNTKTCSVTVPYTEGIDTFLYGVNGYSQYTPITSDVTVTGSLDGTFGTAPQFWIGYTAEAGYEIANPGAAPTHFDFYNGDDVRDC